MFRISLKWLPLTTRHHLSTLFSGLCSNGHILTSETRDGRDASSAAAPPAPQLCLSPRSAGHAPSGRPERDLPSVPLSDWTGDCPGHCYSHHGDFSDHTRHAGTSVQFKSISVTCKYPCAVCDGCVFRHQSRNFFLS